MSEIIFVCTGNTCRSIMAERIMKKLLELNGIKNIKVSSCGIFATGANITNNAKLALKEIDVNYRDRKSRPLKKINNEALYITMTKEHIPYINAPKVVSLASLTGCEDVEDPYGKELKEYIKCAKNLYTILNKLLEKLVKIKGEHI